MPGRRRLIVWSSGEPGCIPTRLPLYISFTLYRRHTYIHTVHTYCDNVPSLQMSMCSDCHALEPGSLFVWHPVDPGSSPGGVTTLSLRYKWCQKWDGLLWGHRRHASKTVWVTSRWVDSCVRDPIDVWSTCVCGALWVEKYSWWMRKECLCACSARVRFPKLRAVWRCAVTTDEYVLWLPCRRAWLFGVAVRVHVWHHVDPGFEFGWGDYALPSLHILYIHYIRTAHRDKWTIPYSHWFKVIVEENYTTIAQVYLSDCEHSVNIKPMTLTL